MHAAPHAGRRGRRTPSSARRDAALLGGSLADARQLYSQAIAKDDGDWELWLGLALASEGDARKQRSRSRNDPESALERDSAAGSG